MASLWHMVREAVASERYLISEHAVERLAERGVLEWQVVASLADGQPLRQRPHAKPHPVIEVAQVLADGTPIKAVWSYIQPIAAAKLVTVHFME